MAARWADGLVASMAGGWAVRKVGSTAAWSELLLAVALVALKAENSVALTAAMLASTMVVAWAELWVAPLDVTTVAA
jgi:hypothetical protein